MEVGGFAAPTEDSEDGGDLVEAVVSEEDLVEDLVEVSDGGDRNLPGDLGTNLHTLSLTV